MNNDYNIISKQISAFEKLASYDDISSADGATTKFKEAVLGKSILPQRMTDAVEHMMKSLEKAYSENSLSSKQVKSLVSSISRIRGSGVALTSYQKFGWFKTVFKKSADIAAEKELFKKKFEEFEKKIQVYSREDKCKEYLETIFHTEEIVGPNESDKDEGFFSSSMLEQIDNLRADAINAHISPDENRHLARIERAYLLTILEHNLLIHGVDLGEKTSTEMKGRLEKIGFPIETRQQERAIQGLIKEFEAKLTKHKEFMALIPKFVPLLNNKGLTEIQKKALEEQVSGLPNTLDNVESNLVFLKNFIKDTGEKILMLNKFNDLRNIFHSLLENKTLIPQQKIDFLARMPTPNTLNVSEPNLDSLEKLIKDTKRAIDIHIDAKARKKQLDA